MKFFKNFLALLFCILFFQSCEISHSVPFDLPDYKPELIIHAAACPKSGAKVNTYPREADAVHQLPAIEVTTLESAYISTYNL